MGWVIATAVLASAAAIGLALWRLLRRTPGQRFDSKGVPIYYTRTGRGEPVVLLHGFAVQSDLNWRLPGIIQALAPEFELIAPDLRGHGRSGKPHDPERYGVEMVEDVVRLLDHLAIERAHIVGYSLGGFIALKLAALYPERVVSLAALGSGWESPENSSFLEAMSGLADTLESGRGIAPLAGKLGEDREPPGRLHTLWVKAMTGYLNDGRALAAMIRALRGVTLEREELGGIRVPVLSVVGTRDALAVGVDAMKGQIADHRIVLVEGADHLQAVRSPELLSALQSFLRAHRTRPPAEVPV